MRKLLPILAIFGCVSVYAQKHEDPLEAIEHRYQECLAKGSNMNGCANAYYQSVDSTLTVTLQSLLNQLNGAALISLQQDQSLWEAKKEVYFKKMDERVEKLHKSTMQGLDDDMISTDNKAAFLKLRVIELYRQYNS